MAGAKYRIPVRNPRAVPFEVFASTFTERILFGIGLYLVYLIGSDMGRGIHVYEPDQLIGPQFPNGRGLGFRAVDPIYIDRPAADQP
jgi:hypothetical protein